MKLQHMPRRAFYVLTACMLIVATVFSGLIQRASAGQVTSRSIRLSSSQASAQNVVYRVGFTTFTTGNIGGIVVDFCSNNPIIGDACTPPAGFNVNRSTTSLNNQSGITGFSIYTADTEDNRIIITKGSPTSVSGAVSFELGNGTNGFTNPSTTGSFYARIYTYTTQAAAQGHDTDTPTGYQDYGGVALSTAAVVNITARVMETLSFCVYDATCGDDPSFTLGTVVGTTTVIDDQAVYTDTVNFSISTNANGGASIRMKGDTLKTAGGGNDINAAGTSAVAFSAGTERFGLRVSTAGTNITATAPYNGAANNYALDVTTAASDTTPNVTSTFGGLIATLSGPVSNSVTTLTFGVTAAATTPAGTYTAAEQLIATGTF